METIGVLDPASGKVLSRRRRNAILLPREERCGYGSLALLRHFPHLRDWRNELDRFWLMQQKSWPFDVVWCRLPT